jgi:DNA mismatch repair protein MutL
MTTPFLKPETMTKIHVLDEVTASQIAAGEVIESPASCVKELVENSLDAGAGRIYVKIQGGGELLIAVQDDGCGMSFEDARLAFYPHATSKISALCDLFSLHTFGFRGEALASMAAVAKVNLMTAEKDDTEAVTRGTSITIHGGKEVSYCQTDCLSGTTIEISDLFYNVPARRKFLKGPARNNAQIIKVMTEIALANPAIEFELSLDESREFLLKSGTLESRARALLGADFSAHFHPLKASIGPFSISGYVGDPAHPRANRTGQYLFINHRPVFSLSCSYAVKEGYGTALEASKHPQFVLFLEVPPSSLDVNVHPQKREVRFRREDEVKSAIANAVAGALFEQEAPAPTPRSFSPTLTLPQFHEEKDVALPPQEASLGTIFEGIAREEGRFRATLLASFQEYLLLELFWNGEAPEQFRKEGLFIMDVRAALARIAFEDLLAPKEAKVCSQKLLMPFFIELGSAEAHLFEKMLPRLSQLGFEARNFGKNGFLIEAIPICLEAGEIEQFIHDLVKEEEEDPAKLTRNIARLAAAASRKKYPLAPEMSRAIISRLALCKEPFLCPFGGPILSLLSKDEIQKRFRQ